VQKVKQLFFRKLTNADFFHINKPPGTEKSGGGQSYIDISTSHVTLGNWREFFKGIPEIKGTNGPWWKFNVYSLGTTQGPQEITIGQRRTTSVSIRSQKLLSKENKRIFAWRPDLTGFPKSPNPTKPSLIYDLCIYIVRLENNEYWAGWFQTSRPEQNWSINGTINKMFTENEGYLKFHGDVSFDTSDPIWPFRITAGSSSLSEPIIPIVVRGDEDAQEKVLFDEDEINASEVAPQIKETMRKVRVRNSKAVLKLKKLYNNLCQITGKQYTFVKKDGSYYSEAHHLIALGKGGADSFYNIVILSPLIHRMLHYAKIEGLDIGKMKNNKLSFKINGNDYVITWHPDHAKIVQNASYSHITL